MNKSDKLDNYLLIIDSIMTRYNLNIEEKEELTSLIYHIIKHKEFKRRMTDEFYHHGKTTLGEHILEDTIITYIICKKKQRKGKKIDLLLAISISLMHDLYTEAWQNNPNKPKKFSNYHGFRHPIEAVINAISWYPEVFNESTNQYALIDGIIHHMYPFPTVCLKDIKENTLGLRNFESLKNIDQKYLDMIILSTKRFHLGTYSLAKAITLEGRIVSKADKIATSRDFDSFQSVIACLGIRIRKFRKN